MTVEKVTPEQETESYEVFVTEAVEDENLQEVQGDDSAQAQDDGQENDDHNADNTSEEKPKKSKGRFQKRIDRLTERAKKAELELEQLRQGNKPNVGEPNNEPNNIEEPDPIDFDDYDKYLDALNKWNDGTEESSNEKAKGTDNRKTKEITEEDQEYKEALEDVTDAFDDSREKYDDFEAVVTADDVQITIDMVKALSETENPGDIAYYLGKHKEEASRIAGLKPMAQAKEIGKLEAKVLNIKQPSKKTTQAPDPIDPVRGSDSSQRSTNDMDFNEYEKTMNERERSGRGFW